MNPLDHLRWGTGACLVLLAVGIPLGWLMAGPVGASGVCAGVCLVTLAFTTSSLVVSWAASVNRSLILPCGLGIYVLKYSAIIAILVALENAEWPGRTALGLAIIAAAVTWSVAQVAWLVIRVQRQAGRSGELP